MADDPTRARSFGHVTCGIARFSLLSLSNPPGPSLLCPTFSPHPPFVSRAVQVLSADAFAAFEEGGLGDEEKVRATGRRFRDTVLACGGGAHPSEVFRAFRGRNPTPDALLRHHGLAP